MRYLLALLVALLLLSCQQEPSDPSANETTPTRPVATVDTGEVAPPDSLTKRLFEDAMTYARAESLHTQPIGIIMQELGLRFRERPYAVGLLDEPPVETLVVALDRYDCVTFVETMLAMARGVQAQDYRFATFARNLEDLRYRQGELDGYASRLHYFSEWIADNRQRGNVTNITPQIGGQPLDKRINFMTEHRESYPKLADDDRLIRRIEAVERDLAGLDLYYVPQDSIRAVYDQLQAGDILALATNIEGLDVSHTGLVYKGDGQTGLLHASTSGGVTVSPDLQRYVQNIKNQIGIVVARPLD